MVNTSAPLIQEELAQIEKILSNFSSNDPLVSFHPEEHLAFQADEIPLSPEISKLLKRAHQRHFQQGYWPLSLSEGWVKTDENSLAPLFIFSVNPIQNRIKNSIRWSFDAQEWMLNPHIQQLIESATDCPLPTEKDKIINVLRDIGLEVEEEPRYVGLFHPFRYALLREVAQLQRKNDLDSFDFLFDGSQKSSLIPPLTLRPLLFPADQFQFEAIVKGLHDSMALQGPPGTGKSQVIANLIGLYLEDGKSVLACTTKKEALEVVVQRLTQVGLGDLCFLRTGDNSAKSLLHALQKSWHHLDQCNAPSINGNCHMESINAFDECLRQYHKEGSIGELSPRQFLKETGLNPGAKAELVSGLPSYTIWKRDKRVVERIPREVIAVLSQVAPEVRLSDSYENLLASWHNWEQELLKLSLPENSFEYLSAYYRKCQAAHVFSGDNYQRWLPILSRKKSVLKLKKDYEKVQLSLAPLEEKMRAWQHLPTLSEFLALEKQWHQVNFWKKRSIRAQQKHWLRLPSLDWKELMAHTKDYFSTKALENQVHTKLLALGITHPEVDFKSFESFCALHSSTLIEAFKEIPKEEIPSMREDYFAVSSLLLAMQRCFQPSPHRDLLALLHALLHPKQSYVPYIKLWESLTKETRIGLRKLEDSKRLEHVIFGNEWQKYLLSHPSMKDFLAHDATVLDTLSKEFEAAGNALGQSILTQRKIQFDAYHKLLGTPNSRLDQETLAHKLRLKEGKRQLVKWFSKQRGLPSVREVLNGHASEWVRMLKPLWFTNPTALAFDFTLEKDLFDVAIIDEASQMPMEHALGAIYRAKRLIVAGDLMQMAPSSYFVKGGADSMSLLDHATYHLPTARLKFHYRSLHPQLIEFSNNAFYDGELVALPCFPNYRAIEDWYQPSGRYADGVNAIEATCCVELLERMLHQNVQRIGIVAFSERQLEAIEKEIDRSNNVKIFEAQASGQLFLKTLEQVQGDECDELIISVGYGYNLEGKLDLRMGPLNHKGGEKRLNVLWTRARIKMHVVRSIGASDFGVVQSEGMRVLKKWLHWLENQPNHQATASIACIGETNAQGEWKVDRVMDVERNYLNLQAYRTMLAQRGWRLKELAFASEQDHTRILPLGDNARFA